MTSVYPSTADRTDVYMFRRVAHRLSTREDGFTIIEALAALALMTTGIVALIGSVDRQRDLVTHSEKKEAAAHVAQREMERVLALAYDKVAFPTGTSLASSSDPNHPDHYVSGGQFQWDRNDSTKVSPIVTAGTGMIAHGPETWTSAPTDAGRITGKIYRYVTRVDDSDCRPVGSCASGAYRRVTIAVTVDGTGGPRLPTLISAYAINPNDGPEGTNGGTYVECLDESGSLAICKGTSNPYTFWYLYDTPATSSSSRQTVSGSHATHPTVASTGALCTSLVTTDCPKPDLMGTTAPPTGELFSNYSNELTGSWTGGRVLRGDTASCNNAPTSTDNTKGQFWVTAPLGAARTLTGAGGLTIFSQNVNAAASGQTLCLAFYNVPASISNLVAAPPTEIGRASLTRSSWPSEMTDVSFRVQFRSGTGNVQIPAGRRIGFRLWTQAGNADIALGYDNADYAGFLQLDEAN
jgi:type II secretory pathway pseudopilin PulG